MFLKTIIPDRLFNSIVMGTTLHHHQTSKCVLNKCCCSISLCMCGETLDYKPENEEFDSYWACVNPDCEVVEINKFGTATLQKEIDNYVEAVAYISKYWTKHHKEYEETLRPEMGE